MESKNPLNLKDLEKVMKKYQEKGMKPYIKGKGCGKIKIEFED